MCLILVLTDIIALDIVFVQEKGMDWKNQICTVHMLHKIKGEIGNICSSLRYSQAQCVAAQAGGGSRSLNGSKMKHSMMRCDMV